MPEESVAHKTARTSLWAGIEKIATMGVQFVVSIIIARLLSPSDYGIIAMLSIFVEIASSVVQCGFGNALIRKQNCKSIDYCTAFYFNFAVSIVMYGVLFVIAPFVASFYEMELLCPVLRVCGLTLIIQALTLVQYTILSKNLEAKKQARIAIVGALFSGAIGLLMAYMGCGVWSLVGQQLSIGLVNVLLLWSSTSWLPQFEFSLDSMKYLWGFGSKMLLTGIISVTYRNIYSLVIGRYYNSSALGLFNRGQSLAVQIPNITEAVFIKNSLPIFSQIQNDNARLIKVYREYIKLACFVTFPAVCLLSVLAEPLVRLVLTEKWLGCVVYIQIFALTSFIGPANSINLNLLQVFGRSDYTLYAEIIKKSTGLLMVFSLITQGPLWLAIGSSCFNVFAYGVNLYYAKQLSGLRYKDQINDVFPIFLCSGLMYLSVYATIQLFDNSLVQIIIGSMVGLLSFFLFARYVFKLEQLNYISKIRTKS